MLMICVTISSDVLLTSFGRSLAGNWRASVFGTILMTLPAGTATYPYTCSTDRTPHKNAAGDIGVADSMVTWR